MKKEIKQITCWQDVLDVWVSKGACFRHETINRISDKSREEIQDFCLRHNTVGGWNKGGVFVRNICEILYSPESNFFEVMFGKDIIDVDENTRMNRCLHHKILCVISYDPLQYLIDNLNETLGSM